MTTGFGIDPIKDPNTGAVTSGTTSADLQQITGSLYTPGLISGGLVTRSASALTYNVSNGVGSFPIVVDNSSPPKPENRRSVLGPVPAANLSVAAPSSGSRVDIIYAQQLTPANDSANTVVVRVGTSLPPRSIMLNAFIISAGQTNTNQTVKTGDVVYSVPYGASMGLWANKRITAVSTLNSTTRQNIITGSFFLPTDRLVRVSVTAAFSALNAYRFDNTYFCEAAFDMSFDGVYRESWTTPGLHQAWAENTYNGIYTLSQGTHTYNLSVYRAIGPGTPMLRDKGVQFTIQDIGPVT